MTYEVLLMIFTLVAVCASLLIAMGSCYLEQKEVFASWRQTVIVWFLFAFIFYAYLLYTLMLAVLAVEAGEPVLGHILRRIGNGF